MKALGPCLAARNMELFGLEMTVGADGGSVFFNIAAIWKLMTVDDVMSV